jgi:hypothetical protein
MKFFRVIAFLFLSLLITFPAVSQETETGDETEDASWDFFLIPIIETAFSGDLRWRPYWPDNIPPDSFLLSEGNETAQSIVLSNETDSFTVRRNRDDRLVIFPFFTVNGYAEVTAAYSPEGALRNMSIKNYTSQSQDDDGQEATEWNIVFPAGFLPYSEISPGGSLPPLRVNTDDSTYHVFIFESPAFLTETWYDSEGNMLAFCKASVSVENGAWRTKSLQINAADGTRFEDYFFDAHGNITEARFEDVVYSAVFRERFPVYWQSNGFRYNLIWDTQGRLTVMKVEGETEDFYTEYRYEYEQNFSGNWVRRQESAYIMQFGLLAPQSSYSRGVWNRRIVFSPAETGSGNGR